MKRLINKEIESYIDAYIKQTGLSTPSALDELLNDFDVEDEIKEYVREHPHIYQPYTIDLDEIAELDDSINESHGITKYIDMSQRDKVFVIIGDVVLVDEPGISHTELLNKYLDKRHFDEIAHPNQDELADAGLQDCIMGAILDNCIFLDTSDANIQDVIKKLNSANIDVKKVYVYSDDLEITRVA